MRESTFAIQERMDTSISRLLLVTTPNRKFCPLQTTMTNKCVTGVGLHALANRRSPSPCLESKPSHLTRILDTILTELPRFT